MNESQKRVARIVAADSVTVRNSRPGRSTPMEFGQVTVTNNEIGQLWYSTPSPVLVYAKHAWDPRLPKVKDWRKRVMGR